MSERNMTIQPGDHIDMWFSDRLQNLEQHKLDAARLFLPTPPVPTASEAALFAVESVYAGGYTPTGVHAPQHYLPGPVLAELLARCPAARNLTITTEIQGVTESV